MHIGKHLRKVNVCRGLFLQFATCLTSALSRWIFRVRVCTLFPSAFIVTFYASKKSF